MAIVGFFVVFFSPHLLEHIFCGSKEDSVSGGHSLEGSMFVGEERSHGSPEKGVEDILRSFGPKWHIYRKKIYITSNHFVKLIFKLAYLLLCESYVIKIYIFFIM